MKPQCHARPRIVARHPEGGVLSLTWGRRPGLFLHLYQPLNGRSWADTVRGMKSSTKPVPVVAYLRVSTKEQQRSGLGLEAQEQQVRQLAEVIGGEVVRVIVETGSGADDDRPGLADALKLAARTRGVVAVAKLDRLSRDVAKVAETLKSGVQIRCADSPNASTLELHLRATIAQEERRLISERTSQALHAAKRRGVLLGFARPGSRRGRSRELAAARAKGSQRAASKAAAIRADILEEAAPILIANEGQSLRKIAAALEEAGVLTAKGRSNWTPASVSRLVSELQAS